jgi:hypothetical protein
VIVKLTGEITAADDPEVAAGCRCSHLFVNGPDIASGEPDVGARHRSEGPCAQNPRRLFVRPGLGLRRFGTHDVPQHPLVSRGAHHERSNVTDERGIAGLLDVAEREQPLERIVRRGDEAVEAGSRVLL